MPAPGCPDPPLQPCVLGRPAVRSTSTPSRCTLLALEKAFAPRMFSNGAGVAAFPPCRWAAALQLMQRCGERGGCEGSGLAAVSSTSPSPRLGRCWLAPQPLSHGDGSSTGAEGRGENLQALLTSPGKLCKTKRLLNYFFSCPIPPRSPWWTLGSFLLARKVSAGLRCQRGTFVFSSPYGGCSPPWTMGAQSP